MTRSFREVLRKRLLGIAFCAFANGPILMIMAAIHDLAFGTSASVVTKAAGEVFSGSNFVAATLGSVPGLLAYAGFMHILRTIDKDSLTLAILCAVPLVQLPIAAIAWSYTPAGFVFVDLTLLGSAGGAIGAFYWLLVIRAERRLAHQQQDLAAVRAME